MTENMEMLIIMYKEYFNGDYLGAVWDAEKYEFRLSVIGEDGRVQVVTYNRTEIREAVS